MKRMDDGEVGRINLLNSSKEWMMGK